MANRGVCILVLEDEETERDILEMQLSQLLQPGEKLVLARHGMDAIEKIKTIDPPIGFILDLNMPGNIKGLDVLRHIRSQSVFADSPVFIFSSSDNAADKRRCQEAGATRFIRKPSDMFDSEALLKRLVNDCRMWNATSGQDDSLSKLLEDMG